MPCYFLQMQAFVRLTLLFFAAAAATASTSSTTNAPSAVGPNAAGANGAPNSVVQGQGNPASSQSIDPSLLVGVWKSNFGPVKIAPDPTGATGKLAGVWVYDRDGAEVIGYFEGALRGNVLSFKWQEPAAGQPLLGGGYLQFDTEGKTYTGRWWTDNRDRSGEWNGWRPQNEEATPETAPVETAPTPVVSTKPI